MSYTELESGYQDLRQQSSQQAAAAAVASSQSHASLTGGAGGIGDRIHQRPGFFVGHDGNVIFHLLIIATSINIFFKLSVLLVFAIVLPLPMDPPPPRYACVTFLVLYS